MTMTPPFDTDDPWFSREEADRYEAAARDVPLGDLCLLLLHCGLRSSEVRNLCRGDLRLASDPPYLTVSLRWLALDQGPAMLLRSRLAAADRAHDQASGWDDPTRLVLTTAFGLPISQDQLRLVHLGICARAGLRPISLHGLRHTAISLLIAAGRPLNQLPGFVRRGKWRGR
jgi:integrase